MDDCFFLHYLTSLGFCAYVAFIKQIVIFGGILQENFLPVITRSKGFNIIKSCIIQEKFYVNVNTYIFMPINEIIDSTNVFLVDVSTKAL